MEKKLVSNLTSHSVQLVSSDGDSVQIQPNASRTPVDVKFLSVVDRSKIKIVGENKAKKKNTTASTTKTTSSNNVISTSESDSDVGFKSSYKK